MTTESEDETRALAASLALLLRGGDVVHLRGDLGTGKTRFVKGLAEGLGLDPDDVRSPTFAFVDVHPAPPGGRGLGLVHVDLYRLADPSEAAELGLAELPGPEAILALEWPERLGDGPPPTLEVTIADLGGARRLVETRWPPPQPGLGEPSREA